MSELAETTDITAIFARYAEVGPDGTTIIGGGLQVVPLQASDDGTLVAPPCAMYVGLAIPAAATPAQAALEITLLGGDGEPVPQNPAAPAEGAIRVAQLLELPEIPADSTPRHLGGAVRFVTSYMNGLTLPGPGSYVWRVSIDGDGEHAVNVPFVATPPSSAAFHPDVALPMPLFG